jgi:hypothetical protein
MTALARQQVTAIEELAVDDSTQILFDVCVLSTRRQGYVRSEGDEEDCMYRSSKGHRCIVGHLLEDVYRPSMEGKTPRFLCEAGIAFTDCGEAELVLLEELQAIHDNASPSEWEAEFKTLAERMGLEYKDPQR